MCTKIYSFESDFGADNYPNEFSWELLDSDTNILASKSNYVYQSKYDCYGGCAFVINNVWELFDTNKHVLAIKLITKTDTHIIIMNNIFR